MLVFTFLLFFSAQIDSWFSDQNNLARQKQEAYDSTNILIDASFSVTGALLDDLLVAEDPLAAETTGAPCEMQSEKDLGCYPNVDETRQRPEDGAVLLGNPVAPPINGDMYKDISSENAVPQGSRLVYILI